MIFRSPISGLQPVRSMGNFAFRQFSDPGWLQRPDEDPPGPCCAGPTVNPLRIPSISATGLAMFPEYLRALGRSDMRAGRTFARSFARPMPIRVTVEVRPPGALQSAAPRSAALIRVDVADCLALPYPGVLRCW